MRIIDKIIVHCSATDLYCNPETFRNYYIGSLGWIDCPYHYLIDVYGEIHEMRPISVVGAHCKGQNETSIGVALIGGKYGFDFSFDQLLSLLALLKRLSNTYKIDRSSIFAHNDFNKNKTCPNFNVKTLLQYEKGFYKAHT